MIRCLQRFASFLFLIVLNWQNCNAQDYPSIEEFDGTINTNIWNLTNVETSSWQQTNGKIIYINSALNGDSDALIFIQKSVPLSRSWEFSFDLHQGTNLVTNTPNTNWAFKKAGFIFANIGSNPLYGYLGAAFYDNGTNTNPEFEYKLLSSTNENFSNQVTHERFVTTFQSPWRSSNSWYPQRSTVTATWSSKSSTLKLKLSQNEGTSGPAPSEGKTEIELVNPFRYKSNSVSLTNVSLGIILKSAYQPIQASDNFALESVSFRIATNQILAFDDDDADGDGISNYDEIIKLKTDPNVYDSNSPISGLYTFDFISNNPTTFGFISPDQIYDVLLGFGPLVLTKNTNNSSFTLNYNILMSTNLSTWSTNETRTYNITNAPANKMFLRIAPIFSSPAAPLDTPL
jgi:hypothetical protein